MKNQDELLHSVRTNLSVQEILSASESEINAEEKDSLDEDELEFANRDETVEDADTEFNAVDTAPHLKPPIGKRGDVNELHAEYVATKTATDGSLRSQLEIRRKRDELLADVSNLALRFFASQEFQDSLEGIVGEDVAQDVVVKVLQKVDTFEFKSKF